MTAIAYWVVFFAAWAGARDERPGHRRPVWPLSVWAVATWVVVAVPTLLQVTVWPRLLDAGMRSGARIEDGQVWRLLTSMTLQDGWTSGAVFNLAILAVTVVLCGPVLAGWRFPAVLIVGGLLANIVTLATQGADGAGNSMATMVTVIVVMLLVRASPRDAARPTGADPDAERTNAAPSPDVSSSQPSATERWAPVVAVVVGGAVLVLTGDEHGWAVVIGLVLGTSAARLSLWAPVERSRPLGDG